MPHLVDVELHYTVPSRNSPSPLRINDLHPLWSNPPEVSHNPPIRQAASGDSDVTRIHRHLSSNYCSAQQAKCLKLALGDYDRQEATPHIRETKFYKSRLLPINGDITDEIERYLRVRARRLPESAGTPLMWHATRGGRHRRSVKNDCRREGRPAGIMIDPPSRDSTDGL